MDNFGAVILAELRAVDRERAARAADPELAARVDAVKKYQHWRFEQSYADLLSSKRFRPAAEFFLADLYGPRDYSQRDVQFARVVPLLTRALPRELLQTLERLASLHALSERLDTRMALALIQHNPQRLPARARTSSGIPSAQSLLRPSSNDYSQAWRHASTPEERSTQIELTLQIGIALERYTQKRFLRQTLHLMRGPAQAAGLGALQNFLEKGFDTFKALNGASEFLGIIQMREHAHASAMFSGRSAPALGAM